MTQTMREQLQALVKDIKFIRNMNVMLDRRRILMELESILAATHPAVTVKRGWVCKDWHGLWWSSNKPIWLAETTEWAAMIDGAAIADPWPDKPDGGPECVMEVR